MSRNKQRITPFPPWQTKSPTGRERSYTRLGESLLMDEAALSLTPGAFQTYCYMLLASKGAREFIYPKNQHTKICASEAFARRKRELIQKGFIKISEHGDNIVGKATLYAFSEEWKNDPEISKPKFRRAPLRVP